MGGPLCVYTVLLGDYEVLNPQPVAERSGVPFICLTDDASLVSPHWQMANVEPVFPMDPIRSQRMLKLRPHAVPALQAFDRSLYIDNSVQLKATPEEIVARCGAASGLGLPRHSMRESVLDEFIEVARLGFDDPARIFEQLNHYQSLGEPALAQRPFWTAILLRDHRSAAVQRAMERWAAHVLRYSRRDQLSLNVALRETGLEPQVWNIDNLGSWFHSWPHTPGRVRHAGMRDPLASAMPLAARLRQMDVLLNAASAHGRKRDEDAAVLRAELAQATVRADALTRQCAELEAQRDAGLAGLDLLQQRDREHQRSIDVLTGHLNELRSEMAASIERGQDALAAMRRSRSWRVTAPLRWLRERLG